jgi:predicted nucleotide-binding protein
LTGVKPLRTALLKKLGVGDRRLNQLIVDKESATLLPRRLAILALAAENGISVRKYASDSDLSQLRGVAASTESASGTRATPSPGGLAPVAPQRQTRQQQRRKPKRSTPSAEPARRRGRNAAVRDSMFRFLRALGLEPLEWRKAIALTDHGTPTVGDILDAAFKHAVAIVVLLTPDDDVTLKPEFRKSNDPPYESQIVGQARPNVLFEAGMAFGRDPRHTVMVQVGEVKHFSDVGGRHVTRLTNTAGSRGELVTKLKNADCIVDESGSDWFSEGSFVIKKERKRGKK